MTTKKMSAAMNTPNLGLRSAEIGSPGARPRTLSHALAIWVAAITVLAMTVLAAPVQAASKKAAAEPITQVYFIRGFMGVFSTGFDKMAKDLEKSRIHAEVYSHLSASAITAKIVREFGQSKKRRKKLVLIGHSFGGNAALSVASQLRQKDIRVDLVITVDPTRSGPVSPNVRKYVNYYFPGNGLGAKLAAKSVPAKRITNIDMRKRSDIAGEGDDHWTITNNAAITKEITTAIKRALR
ncbi:Thioesterase domains of type I polyketide synthase or non-ribosomal peptide synthetase [Hoeflea phototrophica DFL-43]|uniref:Thioesterase domains of type I polyketide synthase or non-ribosomal peptide synthetase n=2 Tax=Hoeflea TaxID=274591 RepID=A9D6A8_HOEPD|nr:Thioesterase domains of type I polyketide synthase or non-ribosomal peptide synthetase [Hoeflea phototrophica DFL-43]